MNKSFFYDIAAFFNGKISLASGRSLCFNSLVHVAVCVTCNDDRLFPCRNERSDAVHNYRRAEHRSVKDGAYGTVRRLPHFLEIIFLDTRGIGSDRRAFDRNAVFLGRVCGIDSDLIIRVVSVFKPEIVILRLEINKRKDKSVFYLLPENTGHFVAVHLHQGSCHSDFIHCFCSL